MYLAFKEPELIVIVIRKYLNLLSFSGNRKDLMKFGERFISSIIRKTSNTSLENMFLHVSTYHCIFNIMQFYKKIA